MKRKTIFVIITALIFGIQTYGAVEKICLKENFRIKDDPGKFFFKYAQNPILNNKGFILIEDDEQLLIFNPKREFVRNVYKKGEGPGEIKSIIGVWPKDTDFRVFNSSPGKMMVFNYQGDLIREVYYKKNIYKANLLTSFDKKYYFTEEEYRNTKKGISVIDTRVKVFSLDSKGNFLGYEKLQFLKQYYLGPRTVMNMHFIQYGNIDNKRFYLVNNGLYDLKIIDLVKSEIRPLVKKRYGRVNIKKEWRKLTHPKSYKTKKKYIRNILDDIMKICVLNNKIWLFTSTFNKQNVVKVDVYEQNGNFKGTLDFPMPNSLPLMTLSYLSMTLTQDNLWIFENPDSEGLCLTSYKIENIPDWAK